MKIAIVNWPINDVGGINSWITNFRLGCEYLGHEVQVFHLTAKTRYKCSETEEIRKTRCCILRGVHRSYRESPDDIIQELNSYDCVIYGSTSPHPTNATLADKGHMNWIKIYEGVTVPSCVIFHDAKWEKTNNWYPRVRGMVDWTIAAQKCFVPSMERWADGQCQTDWEYFPMSTVALTAPAGGPRHNGVIITQWLQWKKHKFFIPMLGDVHVPMAMFGNGIEYCYIRKTDEWKANVYDHVKQEGLPESIHRFWGFVPYEDVMLSLRNAKFSIDLSFRGYTNMSHWEPFWHGTPNFVERRVMEHPHCMLPPEYVEVFDLDESLPERLNSFVPDMDKTAKAQQWVFDKCAPQNVAQRILRKLT
ncbi:MAG: hypothetical protein COA69_09570 [Robiginitomaculum sp.]|nr:MAG: hypothetical protein COA69_09570 [Robiginitomaculum sp.]